MMNFRIKEDLEIPYEIIPGETGLDVQAHSILRVFKGDTEITGAKLKKMQDGFIDRGYIKLRPFERILFGTGIVLEESDHELEIVNKTDIALTRGLVVVPGIIDTVEEEIGVIIYNSTPFLNKVTKNEIVARLKFNFVN